MKVKRILLFVVLFFAFCIMIQLINQLTANGGMTLEGYLVTVEGSHYLIGDEDVDLGKAGKLTSDEMMTFKHVYHLDPIPFSFNKINNGDKVKVYYTGDILESHPAQVSVLKIDKVDK